MHRIYEHLITEHIHQYDQMIFIAGPRQVGKTTLAQLVFSNGHTPLYLNWDNKNHRQLILKGQDAVATYAGADILHTQKKHIIFDEIHKYKKWKSFLKGFYDLYKTRFVIIVTGSVKLSLYTAGGDSLMGRYFIYRLHPFSVCEIISPKRTLKEIVSPRPIDTSAWERLLVFGGFPEPFLKKDMRFYRRWKALRTQQLFREDIRDITHIHDLKRIEILAEFLMQQSGQLVSYSSLSNKLDVSIKTIQAWLHTLSSLYFCFTLSPWSKNIKRSLLKEPKIFLWDWSLCEDTGARHENCVASHLLKAIHFWTDAGLGTYSLHFLRDKEKREVDFVVIRNGVPWFLVEVKSSEQASLSKNLISFHTQLNTQHAFQVVFDMPYIAKSCFSITSPIKVPAATFLSQLV